MSAGFVGFGSASQNCELDLILQDLLAGQGNALNTNIGSLVWCECYAKAVAFNAAIKFGRLMSNQLSPGSMSIFADRWAAIYGLSGINNLEELQAIINIKQEEFGSVANVSNVKSIISDLLGQLFIDLEYLPMNQDLATAGENYNDEGLYNSPLSVLLVRVWQPRDNQNNLLVSTPQFISTVLQYKSILQNWLPAYVELRTEWLVNAGHGMINTISIAQGSNAVVGVGCTFNTDFAAVNVLRPGQEYPNYQPLEVVDDNGNLQTYYVQNVSSNVHMTLLSPALAPVSGRTFRTLGISFDTPYCFDWQLYNV